MVKSYNVDRHKKRKWQRASQRPPATAMCTHRCQQYRPYVRVLCGWKHCTEFYCTGCGRYMFGAGPVGCPCDWWPNVSGNCGHRTRAEQPRPRPPYKPSARVRNRRG